MSSSLRPSTQFIKRGSVAIGLLAIILVVQTTWFRNLFSKKSPEPPVATTVGDIVGRDSNDNGIPDWEERLWGLDPTKRYTGGVSNQKIIEDKKKVLGVTDISEEDLNETDKLARQLFTLTAALGQSEEVDDAALADIANTLGESVEMKEYINQYSLKDIQTIQTTTATLRSYYSAMQKVLATQNDYLVDINSIAGALDAGEVANLEDFSATAIAYKKIAQTLSAVPVPVGVAPYHLQIMNSFAGIAESFTYIQQINDNSIVALAGITMYKTQSTRLNTALINMADYLTKYGILKE